MLSYDIFISFFVKYNIEIFSIKYFGTCTSYHKLQIYEIFYSEKSNSFLNVHMMLWLLWHLFSDIFLISVLSFDGSLEVDETTENPKISRAFNITHGC